MISSELKYKMRKSLSEMSYKKWISVNYSDFIGMSIIFLIPLSTCFLFNLIIENNIISSITSLIFISLILYWWVGTMDAKDCGKIINIKNIKNAIHGLFKEISIASTILVIHFNFILFVFNIFDNLPLSIILSILSYIIPINIFLYIDDVIENVENMKLSKREIREIRMNNILKKIK